MIWFDCDLTSIRLRHDSTVLRPLCDVEAISIRRSFNSFYLLITKQWAGQTILYYTTPTYTIPIPIPLYYTYTILYLCYTILCLKKGATFIFAIPGNFGKFRPILIILSLLYSQIYYWERWYCNDHLTALPCETWMCNCTTFCMLRSLATSLIARSWLDLVSMLRSLATSPHGSKLMGPRVYAEVFSYLPSWLEVDWTSCLCWGL